MKTIPVTKGYKVVHATGAERIQRLLKNSVGNPIPAPPLQRSDVLIATVIFLLSYATFAMLFGKLFPLVEFRDWTDVHSSISALDSIKTLLADMFGRLGMRRVPLDYSEFVGSACGSSITCLNLGSLLPIPVSVSLAYLLARRLGIDRLPALSVIFLFCTSIPMIDVLSWQATMLDKVVLVMILAAMIVFLFFTRTRLDLSQMISCNIAVGLFTIAALKSKEIAFLLPAVLVALAVVEVGHQAGLVRRLGAIVLPVVYSVIFEIFYFVNLRSDANSMDHCLGGNIGSNIVAYAAMLVFSPHSLASVLVGSGIFVAVLLVAYVALGLRSPQITVMGPARSALVLGASAILFLLPCLNTQCQCAFYLYTSAAFLCLTYGALATSIGNLKWGHVFSTPLKTALVLAPVAVGIFSLFTTPANDWLERSNNFTRSFPELARQVKPSFGEKVLFALEPVPGKQLNFQFVTGNLHGLWRFIDFEAAEKLRQKSQILWEVGRAEYVWAADCPTDDSWSVCIRYDGRMNLLSVTKR